MRGLRVRRRKPTGTRRFRKRRPKDAHDSFDFHMGLLGAYVARHRHARVPVRHREGNFCLGRWVTRCRRRHRNGGLSASEARALESLPRWSWDPIEDRFRDALRLLARFAARRGHSRVPNRHHEDAFPLGDWVRTRQWEFRRHRLSAARIALLEALPGWSWRPRQDDFQEGVRLLRRFVHREGHARVPDGHRESGFALGAWVRNRRSEFRGRLLPAARARTLKAVPGWRWSDQESQYEEGLRWLRRFVKREGHALVPARQQEGGFLLGSWVNNRRSQYRRGELAPERARALEALPGWSWRLRGSGRRRGA